MTQLPARRKAAIEGGGMQCVAVAAIGSADQ
jgi:hypothetical protein